MSGIGMSEHDEYHLLKHMWLDYFRHVENKNQRLEKEIETLKNYIERLEMYCDYPVGQCDICDIKYGEECSSSFLYKKHDCGQIFRLCEDCAKNNVCPNCQQFFNRRD